MPIVKSVTRNMLNIVKVIVILLDIWTMGESIGYKVSPIPFSVISLKKIFIMIKIRKLI
jgi:hypothetical protein